MCAMVTTEVAGLSSPHRRRARPCAGSRSSARARGARRITHLQCFLIETEPSQPNEAARRLYVLALERPCLRRYTGFLFRGTTDCIFGRINTGMTSSSFSVRIGSRFSGFTPRPPSRLSFESVGDGLLGGHFSALSRGCSE
jgi:hypothetical protein